MRKVSYLIEARDKYFRKIGFGFNIGIEYNFTENWFLDLRYIHKDSQHKLFNDFGSQVRSIRFGVGYRF